ncbi:histidine phosphatase family protein [Thalassobaculum sp. OXR-137]|uniref:histidine phosphatase family protein n=1 Tax=Thalassobaculum sp. OXR-137 TaxID=3100173 RepID=UPI002AC9B489|nr:histidine phosphatase family protein [Thalassobaculum sp. OXR-137]WPZ34231.1 histidine phosphatase family protein [Thalassobaculum sp. OXR-137]
MTAEPTLYFITHADVVIDPSVAITDWPLTERGRKRMAALAASAWLWRLTALYSSTERKALDGAAVLAGLTGLAPVARADLGENDRSATGYLPPDAFQTAADAFFADPTQSVRGWARAVDEQARIVAALEALMAEAAGDAAVVSHGAVGALALAHYSGEPISRALDQPGAAGGNYFALSIPRRQVLHGWRPVDPS